MSQIITARPQCPEYGLWAVRSIYEKQCFEENLKTIEQLKRICLNKKLHRADKEFKCLSLLSMTLPYKNLDAFDALMNGAIIPLFIEGKKRNYHLDETLDLGSGMKGYGLIPDDDGPAIIMFHGTFSYSVGSGAGQCVLDDSDPLGVGFSHFNFSIKDAVKKWQKKHAERKIMAIGHSLGGAFANYCGVYIDEVKKVRAFCSPLLNKPTYDKYCAKEKLLKHHHHSLDIVNYYHKCDPVRKFSGQRYIGKSYLVNTTEKSQMQFKNLNFIQCHQTPLEAYDDEVKLHLLSNSKLNLRLASDDPSLRTISRIICVPLSLIALTFFTASRILFGYRASHNGLLLTPIMSFLHGIQKKFQPTISDASKQKIIKFLRKNKDLKTAYKKAVENYRNNIFTPQEFALAYLAIYKKYKNNRYIEERVPLKLKLFMKMAQIRVDEKKLTAEQIAEYTFNPKQLLIDKDLGEEEQDDIMQKWEQVEKTGFFQKQELWDELSNVEKTLKDF